jgi:hypothetical protein
MSAIEKENVLFAGINSLLPNSSWILMRNSLIPCGVNIIEGRRGKKR